MKGHRILMSHVSDEWATPRDLFDRLHAIHVFDLDAAATPDNALCARHFTKEQNALTQSWAPARAVWLNPPYSQCAAFVAKAAAEVSRSVILVTMLLPTRTDTRWFHEHIYRRPGSEIEFIKGRLRFSDATHAAPFPSMIVRLWGLH